MPDTGYGTVTFPARTWSDRLSSRPAVPIDARTMLGETRPAITFDCAYT